MWLAVCRPKVIDFSPFVSLNGTSCSYKNGVKCVHEFKTLGCVCVCECVIIPLKIKTIK